MAINVNTGVEASLEERKKFVLAFNDTMVKIWKERITLLDVIDTGTLLNSVIGVRCNADGQFLQIELSQAFRTYGLWQDRGVGKEVARGNPGDIGRNKMRVAKRWFSLKYFASFYKLREFLSDNVGKQFLGMTSDVFETDKFIKQAWH
jgi:hypothetical protein